MVQSEINQNRFHIFFVFYYRAATQLGFRLLELGNSLTALAAEAFIISCNDRNSLTRIQNNILRASVPLGRNVATELEPSLIAT